MMTELQLNSDQVAYCKQFAFDHSDIIMSELGFDLDENGSIKCACPVHGGDNRHGFSWNSEKGIWSCWTNKCHVKCGRDLVGLIAGLNNFSYYDACKWLITQYKLDINNIDTNALAIKSFISKNKKKKPSTHKYYSLSHFKTKDNKVKYLIDRGFSKEIIKEFQCFICNDASHPLFDRVVLPVKDENDNILGFTGRILGKDIYENKWVHYPYSIPVSKILFGLNRSRPFIKNTKTAILVEAPLDMMKLYQNGIRNCVALMGTDLSIDRIKLLVESGVSNVVLALDPDHAGETASEIIKEHIRLYFSVENITSSLYDDPCAMTDAQIKEIFGKYNE